MAVLTPGTAPVQAIAANGEIIPAMTEEELRNAISKPAENAGYKLEIVDTLIEQAQDREGALPLLQFALTRIWEGLKQGKKPAEMLKEIGGVGGALAKEAQHLFDTLKDDEKVIARRAFLSMVTLGEGTKDTRRRIALDNVVGTKENMACVKKVLEKFSAKNARLISFSVEQKTGTMSQIIEITHEALLDHWAQLKEWLNEDRDDLRLQKRLEAAATYWKEQKKPSGLLWRPPDLDLVKKLYEKKKDDFSALQVEFFLASKRAVKLKNLAVVLTVFMIAAVIGAAFYFVKKQEAIAKENFVIAEKQRKKAEENEIKAREQVLIANYNLARVYEEKAAAALKEAETDIKNYQKAWLYNLEALNQNIPDGKSLTKFHTMLENNLIHSVLSSTCASQNKRCQSLASGNSNIRIWESNLLHAYLKSGKESPEFKAVYKCSFDLLPFKLEGISLVPDNSPGDLPSWYNEYPRPKGKDPVQWMIEVSAMALAEKKLSLDGIPQTWADNIVKNITKSSPPLKAAPEIEKFGMKFVYIEPGTIMATMHLMLFLILMVLKMAQNE